MLSRERVNKGTETMNSLRLSPVVICYATLQRKQLLTSHCSANSYLGLFMVCKIVCGFHINIDKGGNPLPKHSKNLLESLNSVAFTKQNKHKNMRLEDFSSTWLNLLLNTFATVGEF